MVRSDLLNWSARMTQVRIAEGWYIDGGGRVEGPFTVSELGARAAAGKLAPADSVSADRVTWVPASTVPGLSFPVRQRLPLTETVVSGSVSPSVSVDQGPETVPVVSVAGYKILDTLGAGACGVVYKARQEKLDRVVALKTVLMPEKASRDLVVRFEREARSLARLQHPNIVAVYDSGMCVSPPEQAFFAMELLDGEDLGARIDRAGPLSERVAWHIIRQSAAALAHASALGIVHRDIKPANLFLVPPPTGFPLPEGVPMVKVTDFGLALSRTEGDPRRSAAGTLLGTPVYMAPEQFAGSDVDVRADIYGLGCTIYHALTGAAPFDGRTVWDVMMKKGAPVPRLAPPVSAETADLVASMLAIQPAERPCDYTELLAKIDALSCMDAGQCSVRALAPSGQSPALAAPAPEPTSVAPPAPRGRRRWVIALAALALLAAGAGLAVLAGAFNRAQEPDRSRERSPGTKSNDPVLPQDWSELLYWPGQIPPWGGHGGPGLVIEKDQQEQVLAGEGVMSRKIDPPASFSVSLDLNPHRARVVEIAIATTAGPHPAHWLVRINGANAALLKRSEEGRDEQIGREVTVPTPGELKQRGLRLYSQVKYERRGGKLTATFRDQLLGSVPDVGLTTTEIRIEAVGGPIRIAAAELEDLTVPK